MTCVVDTHTLVWLLEGNPMLSKAALQALSDPTCKVVVPAIVLAEIAFLYSKNRVAVDIDDIVLYVSSTPNALVYPLDELVVLRLPTNLNIHDAVIVATALVFRDVLGEATVLITRDEEIRRCGLVEVLW